MPTLRKSFIIHKDSLSVLDELSNEQAGLLFKAMKAYQNDEEIELDSLTKIVFSPFKAQFDRDDKKYQKIVERNKNNGLKGGRPRTEANPKNPVKPSGLSGNPENPSKADSVSKSKSKSDSKSDSDSEVNRSLVATAPKFNFKQELLDLGVNKNTLDDWLTVRKRKKASNTKTSLTKILNQISKANLTVDQGIEFACSNDWKGFEAEWYFNKKGINKDILSMSAASDWHKEEDQGF